MPEKILELLESRALTQAQLATELNISVDELKACMDYLKRMGFIKSTVITPTGGSFGGCSGNCSKCGSACSASASSNYILWEIV